MKTTLVIVGYFVGVFVGIIIVAMYASATDTDPNSFIFANICGIIGAILGYNSSRNKKS